MRGPNLAALAAEATWLQGLKARMAPSSIGGGAEARPYLARIVTVSFVTKR
jgi:hypothetical protein